MTASKVAKMRYVTLILTNCIYVLTFHTVPGAKPLGPLHLRELLSGHESTNTILIHFVSATIAESVDAPDPETPTRKSRAGRSLVQEMSDIYHSFPPACVLIIILRKPNPAKRPLDVDASPGEQVIRKSPRKRYVPSLAVLCVYIFHFSVPSSKAIQIIEQSSAVLFIINVARC